WPGGRESSRRELRRARPGPAGREAESGSPDPGGSPRARRRGGPRVPAPPPAPPPRRAAARARGPRRAPPSTRPLRRVSLASEHLQVGAYRLVVRVDVQGAPPQKQRHVPVVVLVRHRSEPQVDVVPEAR